MKLFVWDDVENVSGNYHDNGGLVVIAETLQRAHEIISEATKHAEKPCGALTAAPDFIRECEGPEYVSVHPNAGCC